MVPGSVEAALLASSAKVINPCNNSKHIFFLLHSEWDTLQESKSHVGVFLYFL